MLHMENYCQLGHLLLFFFALWVSLFRVDPNVVYALCVYAYLGSFHLRTALRKILIVLIILTVLTATIDIFRLKVLAGDPSASGFRVCYVLICIQIAIKAVVAFMLIAWVCKRSSTNQTQAVLPPTSAQA